MNGIRRVPHDGWYGQCEVCRKWWPLDDSRTFWPQDTRRPEVCLACTVVGAMLSRTPKRVVREHPKQYPTEAERIAARRKSWRESARRRRAEARMAAAR